MYVGCVAVPNIQCTITMRWYMKETSLVPKCPHENYVKGVWWLRVNFLGTSGHNPAGISTSQRDRTVIQFANPKMPIESNRLPTSMEVSKPHVSLISCIVSLWGSLQPLSISPAWKNMAGKCMGYLFQPENQPKTMHSRVSPGCCLSAFERTHGAHLCRNRDPAIFFTLRTCVM